MLVVAGVCSLVLFHHGGVAGGPSSFVAPSSASSSVPPQHHTSLHHHSLPAGKHAVRTKLKVTHNTAPYSPSGSLAGPGPLAPPVHAPSSSLTLCSGPHNSAHNGVTYGKYRIFDNAWLAPMCIKTVAPGYFRVTKGLGSTNLHTVAAFPNVFTGTHYAIHTPGSIFPMPVSMATTFPFNPTEAWSPPTEPSFYIADYDLWVFNHASQVRGHGNYEVVIAVNNTHNHGPMHLVSGHWFHETTWLTCQRTPGGSCDPGKPEWPILLFASDVSLPRAQLHLGSFLALLANQGYIPRTGTVGSVHFGIECWTGCQGATASVHF